LRGAVGVEAPPAGPGGRASGRERRGLGHRAAARSAPAPLGPDARRRDRRRPHRDPGARLVSPPETETRTGQPAAAPALIDSHAHIDAPRFDGDREEVLARARAAGIEAIVVVSAPADYEALGRAPALAAGRPGLVATAGV